MDITKKSGRNSALDILKGICILCVIITHLEWTDAQRLRFAFPFWISMAVPVFLIITGYLYALSFERRGIHSFRAAYSPSNIIPKVIRYTFPFLFIFVAEYVYKSLLIGFNKSILAILSGFIKGGYGSGSYYYPLLLQFIILFPIVYFVIKKFLAKGCFFFLAVNILYEIVKYYGGMSEKTYRILIFRFLFVIAFGCYVGIKKLNIKKPLMIVSSAVGIAYIIIALYLHKGPPFINYKIYVSVFNVLYILPIVLLFNKGIKCKPIELIGKASYNIFLVQSLYYFVLAKTPGRFFELNMPLQILISIGICCAAGTLYYLVEKPVTDRLIKKTNQWLMRGSK